MNTSAVNNRIYAAMIAAMVGPWLENRGVKLSEDQLIELVGLAPVAFHVLAGLWAKACAAFVMYFPPKNPPQPVAPAKVVP